ncbi:EXS-domain-containing protein [Athelia psychrophila]|uniref:EXS-domain-containing protein n=1 Tax=Athelia psychrophila TaxID=1759441 RepID=A0A166GT08_9AGAM|nr:EXS-domain-containing protein [Fibularhizoctonia sp. CBS 109695]
MFNPLPVFFRSSRWWLLRSVGELLISGVHRVEFTDFWMGDQFCSLVFTLTHLYFTGCAYRLGFPPNVFTACGVQTHQGWSVQFVLAILPFAVRLVQSIRRYADSGLPTHLVNGGKYTMGIVYYLAYFVWRFHGQSSRGAPFIAWCFFGTVYSVYACTWDYLMDWSLFKPHARYPLLRSDLVYTNEIPFYYFALVSNLLIRFIWVLYIPVAGPSIILRTFIGGFLEMLRRWQWNFYRLENEHTGNMDQYRISREVPLPYTVDAQEDEDGDEDAVSQRSLWLPGAHRRKNERGTNMRRMTSPVIREGGGAAA